MEKFNTIAELKIAVLGHEIFRHKWFGEVFELLECEPAWFAPDQLQNIIEFSPDALLTCEEFNTELRLTVAGVKRAGIPVIYVMDGVIEWAYIWENQSFVQPDSTMMQPLFADKLCTIGNHPARLFASMGLADRIEVVGLPRLDSIQRQRTVAIREKKKVVIATANTYSHNTAHEIWVKSALRHLHEFFATNSDNFEAIWRIAEDLSSELGVTLDKEIGIIEVLKNSDALITFPSTVALEGMKLGVPTSIIDFRPVPQLFSSAWNIRSPAHIEPVIQELIHPPAEKMAYQEHCFEDELAPGNATSRLADVIVRTVQSSTKTEEKYDSETTVAAPFGPLDFRNVHSQISSFSLSDVAMLQYELETAHKVLNKYKNIVQTIKSSKLYFLFRVYRKVMKSIGLYRV